MKQVIFTVITALLVIVFLEAVLNLCALVSPPIEEVLASPWAARSIPDKRLKMRPSPLYSDHDSKGFRNPEVPEKSDVVALGDSQTYGTGVKSDEAWPKQLEPMISQTVYSMAYGGYGPVHSLVLWDEATALAPKIIIEAVYAGNDLYEAFKMVYGRDQFVELKTSDPQVQSSVREAEKSGTIAEQVSKMYYMGKTNNLSTQKSSPSQGALLEHSKIYALLRRVKFEFLRILTSPQDQDPQHMWEYAKARAEDNPAYSQVFNNGQFRTIFTSEYRFVALNLNDPRIAEGNKIILRALQKMKENAIDRNIRFIVLLIPTKELVFQELWGSPSSAYRNLTENEEFFWKNTRDYLELNGIEYVDALPALREKLSLGIQPYKVSKDGHPNEHGHRAIAKLIAAYLKETL